jgi:hypothetical protein
MMKINFWLKNKKTDLLPASSLGLGLSASLGAVACPLAFN